MRPPRPVDIEIDITATKKLNRYAFQIKRSPVVNRLAAGSILSATHHTLLTAALVTALKTLSVHNVARVFVEHREVPDMQTGVDNPPRKLKLLVRCSDKIFIEACTDAANKCGQTSKRVRSAGTMLQELAQEMRRFQMGFALVDENYVTTAREYAYKTMPKRTFRCGFPLPQAISTTGK
jgi:hypothetical protein